MDDLTRGTSVCRDAGAGTVVLLANIGPPIPSIFDAVTMELQQWQHLPQIRFINGYHDDPVYVTTVADSVRAHWDTHGRCDRLLVSVHSISMRCHRNGDPRYALSQTMAQLLAHELGLEDDSWALGFQSRVGRGEWLKPDTIDLLRQWGKQGVRKVQVVFPCFPIDCLETLDETGIKGKQTFIDAGGSSLEIIPALNASDEHVRMLAHLIRRHSRGWDSASLPVSKRVLQAPGH